MQLAEKQLALLEKEKTLLAQEQTLAVLTEEVGVAAAFSFLREHAVRLVLLQQIEIHRRKYSSICCPFHIPIRLDAHFDGKRT